MALSVVSIAFDTAEMRRMNRTCGIHLVTEIKYSQQAARLNSGHKMPASCNYIFFNN